MIDREKLHVGGRYLWSGDLVKVIFIGMKTVTYTYDEDRNEDARTIASFCAAVTIAPAKRTRYVNVWYNADKGVYIMVPNGYPTLAVAEKYARSVLNGDEHLTIIEVEIPYET